MQSLTTIEQKLTTKALASWERVRSSGELQSLIERRAVAAKLDF